MTTFTSRALRSALVLGMVAPFLVSTAPAGAVAGFGDVAGGRYYTAAVQWMVDGDITTGISPTCFATERATTRGEAAAFIWRAEGRPDPATAHGFVDVTRPWQQDPVSWMAENGITTGTSATTFSPERPVTRGEFAVLLYRLAGSPAPGPAHSFTDVTAPWQQDAVSWLANQGITTGTSATTFSPDRSLSRAEAATLLYRYYDEPAVTVDPSTPACLPWHRGAANPTPADAVQEFVDFVGLTDATLGEFKQGDSRSGEIDIDTKANPGTIFDFPTTAFARLDANDNWVVIGAASEAIEVSVPASDASVSSPMRTVFDHNAMSAGVILEIWPDGADAPVVRETLTIGTGVFALDTWDVEVEIPAGVSGPATLVYTSVFDGGGSTTVPKFATTHRVTISP